MTDTMKTTQGETADAARAVGSKAKERASDVASTASDEAKAVAYDAKDQAREVVQRSREQLRVEASQQTDRLASTLRDVGEQLRAMSRGEAEPDSRITSMTSQLADTVTNAAGRLSDGGFDGAISDVKRFARNRPGMFLIGALGAGFVVGRVVKAIDTGSLLQAAKREEGPDYDPAIGAGTGAIGASSSFDPQRAPYESATSYDPAVPYEPASSLPPPTTGIPGSGVPPEVP